ncbi:hypothetical protein GE300_20220 [Rhodobacteraceae bacterium 2CG4]|uniref:Uncharacterized protein n=1 Tax=Halovulum marinum TaxID=2662447 RepID=A0A6L5Z5S4_9RHOB|nr:hypothetical protein [Halovulum marinum]MSU91893.1 hypothetical protein [Halovulum marinum]
MGEKDERARAVRRAMFRVAAKDFEYVALVGLLRSTFFLACACLLMIWISAEAGQMANDWLRPNPGYVDQGIEILLVIIAALLALIFPGLLGFWAITAIDEAFCRRASERRNRRVARELRSVGEDPIISEEDLYNVRRLSEDDGLHLPPSHLFIAPSARKLVVSLFQLCELIGTLDDDSMGGGFR